MGVVTWFGSAADGGRHFGDAGGATSDLQVRRLRRGTLVYSGDACSGDAAGVRSSVTGGAVIRETLMRAARLGDDIDDFCVKCKRVMNHSVVSILNNAPAKVRCRTCHSDHDFRNEQPPPPKVDPRKAALFNQVLGNVTGLPPETPAEAPAVLEAEAEPAADA